MSAHTLLTAALLLVSSASLSCAAPPPAAPPAATPAASQHRVFIDPITGEKRAPTAEELATLNARHPAEAKSQQPVEVITHPDGSKQAILHGHGRHYVKAHIGADGQVVKDCEDEVAPATGTQP